MNQPPDTITRTTCRICGSDKLMFLYSLGTVCISGFVDAHEKERRAPLEMIMCQDCSLVQLRHTAPQELLYSGHYWYKSGVTDTMKAALRDITAQIERIVPLKKGDVVLDIGSNDGTMLRTYTIPGLIKVGVEPATNFAKEGREGVDVFINDFWHIQSYSDQVSQKAKVITAIGMFYDMDDPNEFIRDVAAALDPDGMFIAQLMCLKNMLDTNDLGNICHEHLEYYSLKTLQYLYQKNNLEIIDIQYNTVNGGSYRIFARLQGSNVPKQPSAKSRMRRFFAAEKGFDTKKVHTDFFARIEANKQKTVDFIKGEVAKGKTVWAYGASTKGNTILQFFGLDHTLIAGAADRSPDKWGKMTVGTHIPIYSEDDARKAKPDYFLVLPYSFIKEFYAREKDWLAGGGKFIVPLPEFRVIS